MSARPQKPLVAAQPSVAPLVPQPPPLQKHVAEVRAEEKHEREAIRDADFEELMAGVLAKQLGGEQAMKEACAAAEREEPVEIEKTVFGDLDGDGIEEAVVTAFSCQSGQSPPDMFAVFKRQASGDVAELKVEDTQESPKFKDSKLSKDLRGPWSVEIDKGRLVVRYLNWAPDAPKCGESDCTTDFVYQWDGQKLALIDITQSPVK
ncbi:MAG TPA: hypothetical protein VEI73_00225 [Candidatus Acidoferrum sp.]|nr:hypothetical protein [Candidatus Acidoferrum sp.]